MESKLINLLFTLSLLNCPLCLKKVQAMDLDQLIGHFNFCSSNSFTSHQNYHFQQSSYQFQPIFNPQNVRKRSFNSFSTSSCSSPSLSLSPSSSKRLKISKSNYPRLQVLKKEKANLNKSVNCENDQRIVANIRERERTKIMNDAFSNLRKKVPSLPSDKLSKIQTLKLASEYIQFLIKVLQNSSHSLQIDQYSNVSKNLSSTFNAWRFEKLRSS